MSTRDRWLALTTAIAFAMAAAGAVYAAYTLAPLIASDPQARRALRPFAVAFAAALAIIVIIFETRRRR